MKVDENNSTTSPTSVTKESTAVSSESTNISLNDFVGGWGIPNSGVLFFINADNTITNSSAETVPISNITFQYLPDKSAKISYIRNEVNEEVIKNSDGTISVGGRIYEYLGNLTMEQFLAQNSNPEASSEVASPSKTNRESDFVENQPTQNSHQLESIGKVEEIEIYFERQKEMIISKKKKQISQWKSNGEVDWTDETISGYMYNFITYLDNPLKFSSQVNSASVQEIKNAIDNHFQHAYDTMVQK